jgi:predicted transcriptional regulator
MGRRRSEVQILTDILNISLNGVKITRLMYQANLSYATLRKYLLATMKQKLVEKFNSSDGSVEYYTTEKGKIFLRKLKEVTHVLRS